MRDIRAVSKKVGLRLPGEKWEIIFLYIMYRLFAKKDVTNIIHNSSHRKTSIICTVG